MVNYESIISLLSIMLILIILFVVLFGCRCYNYYEHFETSKEEKKEEKKGQEKFINEMKEKMKNENMGNGEGLSEYENTILKAFSTGKMTPEKFADLINKEQFTEDNLDNLISYVEKFKGGLGV